MRVPAACTYFCQTSRSTGDAGIHRQQKYDGAFGIIDSVSSGLGAQRVESRRIEHDQPAFRSGMRIADQRMAPCRIWTAVAVLDHDRLHRQIDLIPHEDFCFFDADGLDSTRFCIACTISARDSMLSRILIHSTG